MKIHPRTEIALIIIVVALLFLLSIAISIGIIAAGVSLGRHIDLFVAGLS